METPGAGSSEVNDLWSAVSSSQGPDRLETVITWIRKHRAREEPLINDNAGLQPRFKRSWMDYGRFAYANVHEWVGRTLCCRCRARPRPPLGLRWDAAGRGPPVAIVTGANSGIGFEIAEKLAEEGFRVVMACRNVASGRARLQEKIDRHEEHESALERVQPLDLTSPHSIDAFVTWFYKTHGELSLLVNNAGIMYSPDRAKHKVCDLVWQTNAVGPQHLTLLLLPALLQAASARIVNVASVAQQLGLATNPLDARYGQVASYFSSKLHNVIFTRYLQKVFSASGRNDILCVAVHPGQVGTRLYRQTRLLEWLGKTCLQTPSQGAYFPLLACLRSGAELVPGGFYYQQAHSLPVPDALIPQTQFFVAGSINNAVLKLFDAKRKVF